MEERGLQKLKSSVLEGKETQSPNNLSELGRRTQLQPIPELQRVRL
jgi:hypothetical protein